MKKSVLYAFFIAVLFSMLQLSAFAANASLTVTSFNSNVITVDYTGATSDKDWVGLYKEGEVPGQNNAVSIAFVYLKTGDGTATINMGDTSVNQSSLITLPSGNYTLYLCLNDGYEVVAQASVVIPNISVPADTTTFTNTKYISDLEWKYWKMYASTSEDEAPLYQPSRDSEENGGIINIGGLYYAKGFRYHPSDDKLDGSKYAEVVVDISTLDVDHFYAVVGKDSVGQKGHNIQFAVQADGVELYKTAVLTKQASEVIDIALPVGTKELTLIALDGGDDYYDDSCAWGDAKVYKTATSAAAAVTEAAAETAAITVAETSVAAETPAETVSAPATSDGAIIIAVAVIAVIATATVVISKKKHKA